jgi:hypothetical protein
MDKQRARRLYELADRLSKLDVNTLSEEQRQQRNAMIAKLQEEVKSVTGDTNGEYDDEAGMAKGSLQTMSRAVNGLMDTIQDSDDLPEWCQEKLSLAEDYLTTVWDYLLSQKEQGIDPKMESVDNGMPKDVKNKNSKLTAVTMKKTDPVSEEINNEAYERLHKVFDFSNYKG